MTEPNRSTLQAARPRAGEPKVTRGRTTIADGAVEKIAGIAAQEVPEPTHWSADSNGVGAGVLSVETWVRMLIDAGYPIGDAQVEIGRIQSRAFEAVVRRSDATGDSDAVRTYLGLPKPDSGIPSIPAAPLGTDHR
ncbi:hypothetical protein [Streptomyces sp. NPDC059371]|uniref:hypothetical protein n=1 Tax=Streptomyces sp. NPDC059371 TaxID=3346812 RepID=UPI0036C30169